MNKLAGAVIALFFVVILCLTLTVAKDCGDRGGEYMRNWLGWYVCVGVK